MVTTTIRIRRYCTSSTPALKHISELINNKTAKKIMLVAGAGISTPSGLPDFRTPGSGLYANLQKYNLNSPEDIFDIHIFRRNPKPFYDLSKSLYPGQYKPNIAHYFARLLQEKGILLRMYTQNIDALERDKLVEAHGSFATASCVRCGKCYNAEDIRSTIFDDQIPLCTKCHGLIKPDIVFFGEDLPSRFRMYMTDAHDADLAIVMGTSLQVYPFAAVVLEIPPTTTKLLINKHYVGGFNGKNDHVFEGDIVKGVTELIKLCNWTSDIEQLMNK